MKKLIDYYKEQGKCKGGIIYDKRCLHKTIKSLENAVDDLLCKVAALESKLKNTNKDMDIIEKMEELKAKGSKYISLTCKYGEWTFGADHNNGDFSCSKGCKAPEEAVQQVLTKIKL